MKEFKISISLAAIMYLFAGCAIPEEKNAEKRSFDSPSYELAENWAKFPEDFALGNPAGVGIDSDGHLWVFHRAGGVPIGAPEGTRIQQNMITKLDRASGEILSSWGKGLFVKPHGLEIDENNHIWVTDVGLHQVFKFSSDGELLMSLGEPGVAGDDAAHFDRPTDVAAAPDGAFYVSDGYGNSRIMKFSADGTFLFQWGTLGSGNGQFHIPHGIDLDGDGHVYVADRENNRIQKFDPKGRFLAVWQNQGTDQLHSVAIDRKRNQLFGIDYWVGDDGVVRGSDIFRFDLDLKLQAQFGRTGSYIGPATRYHDLCVDAGGNIYLGDILGNRVHKFRQRGSTTQN